VMFAQPIEQSFAVVKVDELDGVRVLQANQDVGSTHNGRLPLTQVPALNSVSVAIDPLTVPMDVALETTSKTIVTLPRTGVVVEFAAAKERSALVRLALPNGAPMPTGAVVQIDGRSELFPVGLDGETYLTKLADRQSLIIRYNASRCGLTLELDPKGPAIADVGPLRCEAVASETTRERQ